MLANVVQLRDFYMEDEMIREWSVLFPRYTARNCIIALAGRSNNVEMMRDLCADLRLPATTIIAMRPFNWAWYPQPMSSFDQHEAVEGLKHARQAINEAVEQVAMAFKFEKRDITLLGFS